MRVLVLAMAVCALAFGQAGPVEKRLAEMLADKIADKAGHDAARDAGRDVEKLDKATVDAYLREEEDKKLERDIRGCATQVVILGPLKSAVRAAGKSAVAEYKRPAATGESVLRAADQGFEGKLTDQAAAFRNEPKNALAGILNCVIRKQVHNPVSVALLKCGVAKMVRAQSCFEATLESLIGPF